MSDRTTNLYRYESDQLCWPSFRLLRVLPGDLGAPIHCELYQASQDETYEALSYVWGSDQRVEPIKVNNRTLWITGNLFAALQHIRYDGRERVLWIDGICINQENNEEKSNQVQNMSTIYAQADRVVVWLGQATLDIARFMEVLVEVQGQVDQYPFECRNQETVQNLLAQQDIDKDSISRGVRQLFDHAWFSRLWILQEIANARSAQISTGVYAVDAYLFAAATGMMSLSDCGRLPVMELMPVGPRSGKPRLQKDLFTCLEKFRSYKTSDERDLVYALLNLSGDSRDQTGIKVDYAKSFASVLQDAMRSIVASQTASIPQVLKFMASFVQMQVFYIRLYPPIEVPEWNRLIPSRDCNAASTIYIMDWVPDESWERFKPQGEVREMLELGADVHYIPPPWDDLASSSESSQLFSELLWLTKAKERRQMQLFGGLLRFASPFAEAKRPSKILHELWDDSTNVHIFHSPWSGAILDEAVARGSSTVTEWILRLKPALDVHAEDWHLEWFLCMACGDSRNPTVVRALLSAGADPNVCSDHSAHWFWRKYSQTSLQEMSLQEMSLLEMVSSSMRAGGDEEAIFRLLLEWGADLDDSNALYIAASRGMGKVVRILLDAGATVKFLDPEIDSALTWAVYKGQTGKVRRLLKDGAPVNGFMLAAAKDNGAMLELLKTHEVRKAQDLPDWKDRSGRVHNSKCIRCRKKREFAGTFPSPDVQSRNLVAR